MKRPSDQAKLLFLGLLRTVTALATDAAGRGGFSQTALFSASAAAATASMPRRNLPQSHHHPFQQAPSPSPSSLVASTTIAQTSTSKAPRTSASTITIPVQVRLAQLSDVPAVSDCNTLTLPENYNHLFYQHHIQEWPDLALVAVVENNKGSRSSCDSRPTNRGTNNSHTNGLRMNQNNWLQFGISSGSVLSSSAADHNDASEDVTVVAYLLGKIQERSRDPDFRPSRYPTESNVGVERFGHVSSLAVLPGYRRQGLAQLLLDQFHNHLIPQQCSFAGLHVRRSNTAAVKLYESLGYEPFSTIHAYYEDGEDAYYMKKLLSSHSASQQSGAAAFSTSQSFLESLTTRLRPPARVWESGPQELRLPRTVHVNVAPSTAAAAAAMEEQQQSRHLHPRCNSSSSW